MLLLMYEVEGATFEVLSVKGKSKTAHDVINRVMTEIYRSIRYTSMAINLV